MKVSERTVLFVLRHITGFSDERQAFCAFGGITGEGQRQGLLHQYPYLLFYPIPIQQEGFCMNVIGLTANPRGNDSNTLRTVRNIRKWFAYEYDRHIQRGWMK